MPSQHSPRSWTRDGYLISTDPTLIPLTTLNTAWDTPLLHWAKALPLSDLQTAVNNSFNFGLYSPTSLPPPSTDPDDKLIAGGKEGAAEVVHEIASHVKPSSTAEPASRPPTQRIPTGTETPPNLIGYARLITDYVTFAYLTDVYILPEHQGQGLGEWLVRCVQETLAEMPHLRRALMITGGGKKSSVGWYEKVMGWKESKDEGRSYSLLEFKGRGNVF